MRYPSGQLGSEATLTRAKNRAPDQSFLWRRSHASRLIVFVLGLLRLVPARHAASHSKIVIQTAVRSSGGVGPDRARQYGGRQPLDQAAHRALDPDNFTVRKQIWMVEHPERLFPVIDSAWQKEQMPLEGYVRPTCQSCRPIN